MTKILVTILLLLGNGLFVGGEFALIASRRTALEPLAATSKRARWALSAMNQIPLMIAGAQLGITVCSLGLGALAEPALAHLLEGPFAALGMPENAVHPVAFVLALVVVVFLHTVIGEMVPKNITLAGPERTALLLGPFMLAFCTATKPLLNAMRWAARTVLRLWKIEATEAVKTVFTAEELAGMVTQARSEGLLGSEQYARIHAALGLNDRTAADTLRPWSGRDDGGRRRVTGHDRGAGHPHRPVAFPGGAAGDPPGAGLRARQGHPGVRGRAAQPADPGRPDPAAGRGAAGPHARRPAARHAPRPPAHRAGQRRPAARSA